MTKNHYTHIKSVFAPQEGGNVYGKRRWMGVTKQREGGCHGNSVASLKSVDLRTAVRAL